MQTVSHPSKMSKPTKAPKAWRRIAHYVAETGLGRDAFLAACKRGDLPFEIAQLGPRGIWYARERARPPIDPAAVFAARARS